jgi:hypothetical protein
MIRQKKKWPAKKPKKMMTIIPTLPFCLSLLAFIPLLAFVFFLPPLYLSLPVFVPFLVCLYAFPCLRYAIPCPHL